MNNTWIPLRHNSLNKVFHTFSIVFFETLEYLLSLPDTVALKSRVCVSGIRGSSIWFQRDLKNNLVKARTAKIHGVESLARKLWCQIFRRRRTGVRWRGHVRRLLSILSECLILFYFPSTVIDKKRFSQSLLYWTTTSWVSVVCVEKVNSWTLLQTYWLTVSVGESWESDFGQFLQMILKHSNI